MLIIPDPNTMFLDPFVKAPTVSLICDVFEPATKEKYSRCPRNIAQKAEAYLKSTGIADTAYFGPEAEFLYLMMFVSIPVLTSLSILLIQWKVNGIVVVKKIRTLDTNHDSKS